MNGKLPTKTEIGLQVFQSPVCILERFASSSKVQRVERAYRALGSAAEESKIHVPSQTVRSPGVDKSGPHFSSVQE